MHTCTAVLVGEWTLRGE